LSALGGVIGLAASFYGLGHASPPEIVHGDLASDIQSAVPLIILMGGSFMGAIGGACASITIVENIYHPIKEKIQRKRHK